MTPAFLCVECGAAISMHGPEIACRCGWNAPGQSGTYAEFLSTYQLPAYEWKAKHTYRAICDGGGPEQPWAANDAVNRAGNELHQLQIRTVLEYRPDNAALLVDVSAGCGLHVTALASHFAQVVHWEAHIPSITHAAAVYRQRGITNVSICRGTYLSLHIAAETADVVLAFDTFERGLEHDTNLLRNIRSVLSSRGVAVVDYHSRGGEDAAVMAYTDDDFRRIARAARLSVTALRPGAYGPTIRYQSNALCWHAARLFAVATRRPARKIAVLRKA